MLIFDFEHTARKRRYYAPYDNATNKQLTKAVDFLGFMRVVPPPQPKILLLTGEGFSLLVV